MINENTQQNQRQLYQDYHTDNPFENFGENTFFGIQADAAYSDAISTLDFGCGNGYAVKKMRSINREWYGLEYSEAAYKRHLNESFFFVGDTQQFGDRQFDMCYSTEVLEHIPEELINSTIADICRVTSRYLFLTISLRPSSNNNKYHCTLKPRIWWESIFTSHGFEVDQPVIDLYQRRTLKSSKEIFRHWAHFGPKAAEFAQNPPFKLNGEREFWFFCFRRRGIKPRPLPQALVPWQNRILIPFVRRIIYPSGN